MLNYNFNIYRSQNGTWRVNFSYNSLFYGKRKTTCKRGFALKREAIMWAHRNLEEYITNKECDLFKAEIEKIEKESEMLTKMYENYKKNRKDIYQYE